MKNHFSVILTRGSENIVIEVEEDEYIWDAARRAGLDLPGSCLQGWCLTCAAQLLEGEIDQNDAFRYYPEDYRAGYVLLCTAKPKSPVRLLIHQKEAARANRRKLGLPTPRG